MVIGCKFKSFFCLLAQIRVDLEYLCLQSCPAHVNIFLALGIIAQLVRVPR